VGLDHVATAGRSSDGRPEQDVVDEDEVGGQALAERGGVRVDPRVELHTAAVLQELDLVALVFVQHEYGQEAADVWAHGVCAAEVVALWMRLLGEHGHIVALAPPLAHELAGVDVRARARQQIAMPDEDAHRARLPGNGRRGFRLRCREGMTKRTILLIEDEGAISEPLAAALGREGFDAIVADTAAKGLELFDSRSPDLVLLDVMLPDGDGRDVLRRIRETSRTPVVMLTARGEEMDRVLGLELGADDYVTKPFSAAELAARIRAVLRRVGDTAEPGGVVLEAGDVHMDLDTHEVTRAGEPLELTVKEFELLRVLLERAGKLVKRDELVHEVWDPAWFGSTKTLDVHVSALRRKLGDDPAEPRYIHTVRGVGFRFEA
jgi:two-component system response regulator RegX3